MTARTTRAAGVKAAVHPVYLVDGDDPALISEAVAFLVDELAGDADRNLTVEDPRPEEVELAAVADSCATPPFLAERRIVVVRDVGRFSTEEAAPLIAYLEDPLPSTVLVLAGGGGAAAPKLVAAVKAKGHVVSSKVGGREAAGWVHQRVRSGPVMLDAEAEQLVRAHLGEDLGRLGTLLDVLAAAYGEDARLGVDDVRPYLGEAGSVAPWDLTDSIDAGNAETALDVLRRMLTAGDRHPLVVLAILHRHVQSLMQVDSPSVRTEADAAQAMGIARGRSTYPAKKALLAAQRWGSRAIAEAIGLVSDAEIDLKGRSAWPPDAILDVLVARLCRLARAAPPTSPRSSRGR